MKILFVLLSVLNYEYSRSSKQPNHASLTQSVDVACSKSGTNYSMTVYLAAGNDSIDLLYTVDYLDPAVVSIGLFDSNGNGITGDGSDENPYTFTITGTRDVPGSPITLQQTDRDNKKAYVKSPDVIGIYLISKGVYIDSFSHQMFYPQDVHHYLYCNYSQIQDDIIRSGQTFSTRPIGVAGYTLDDTAVLDIVQSNTLTNSVSLSDEIQLSVKAITPTRSAGVYVHSCSICDTADCSGVAIEFISHTGCSLVSYFTPFVRNADHSASTESFKAFSINDQDYVYFRCSVNFCYSKADSRCQNYCAYNSHDRRKRHTSISQPSGDTLVTSALRIRRKERGRILPAEGTRPTKVTSPDGAVSSHWDFTLLTVVMTVSGLLVLGIAAFSILFWRTTRCSKDVE